MTDWRGMADRANKSVLRTFRESEPIIYTPAATGIPIALVVFFERTVFEVDINSQVGRHTYRPRVFLMLEDLGRDPADGDQLQILGYNYIVSHEERDGYGGSTLYLARLD